MSKRKSYTVTGVAKALNLGYAKFVYGIREGEFPFVKAKIKKGKDGKILYEYIFNPLETAKYINSFREFYQKNEG